MELRGCSQVHFISVIMHGEVIKKLNIVRGKPELKFKSIGQIYDSDGSICQEFLLKHPSKVDRSLALCNKVDKEKTEVKHECIEEGNELDFGAVTLKQLKRTCKSNKRKAPKSIKLATVKQEVRDSHCQEEELELKETLVSLKRKVPKKAITKKKKTSKHGSPSSEVDNLGSISEDTLSSLALVDNSRELYKSPRIKVGPEPSYEHPQAVSFILSDDHSNSTAVITGPVECCSSDKARDKKLGDQEMGCLTQFFRESSVQLKSTDTPNSVLNQTSYDFVEHMGLDPVVPECFSFEERMMIEDSEVSDQPSVCCGSESPREEDTNSESYECPHIRVEDPEPSYEHTQAVSFFLSEDHSSSIAEMTGPVKFCSSDKAHDTNLGDQERGYLTQCFQEFPDQPKSPGTPNCVLSQMSYDFIEHMGHDPGVPESSSFEERMMIEDSEASDQLSVCCGSESPGEEDISRELYKSSQIKVEDLEPSYEHPQAVSFILSNDHSNSVAEMTGPVEFSSSDKAGDEEQGYLTPGFQECLVLHKSTDMPNCVRSQISYDSVVDMGHNPAVPKSFSFEESMMMEDSEVTHQPSVCCGSESHREEDITDPMIPITCNTSPERDLSECDSFVFQDYRPSSFESEAATAEESLLMSQSLCIGKDTQNDEPSKSQDDNRLTEIVKSNPLNHHKKYEKELPSVDGLTSLDKRTTVVDEKEFTVRDSVNTELEASKCLNGGIDKLVLENHVRDSISAWQTKSVASLPSNTFLVEDECSLVDDYVTPLFRSPAIQSSNDTEEMSGSAASEGNENDKIPHPPERLLSARKIISPTSQERLCKAMNFDERQGGVEAHSCKEKLLFENNEGRSSTRQGVKRVRIIPSSKRPETTNTVEIQTQARQRMRKRKNEGDVPQLRGCGTECSPTSLNAVNVCSSVQTCSQNAIAFSKRQVYGIERIAKKLAKGLQSMKSIVVDALQYESRMGTNFRYNTDQARVAVENVTKAEETAQRWLALMSRDCDRFCKIMRIAEADASSPVKREAENLSIPDTKMVPKERKIMFADEVGGSLCNVKVFKKFEDMDVDDNQVKRRFTREG